MTDQALLEAAQRGDEDAYAQLVAPYRSQLQAHCYRMLGSVMDAEDALQEALLRAWRGLPRFEGRSSLRSWLYTIATNACLKTLERRPKRVLPVDYGPPADPHDGPGEPLVESAWIEPYPADAFGIDDGLASPEARYEQLESVELAFIAALQHLSPRQRAVLILRDVLGFSAREVAVTLDATPASVDSALQRAHKTVNRLLPEQRQRATLRSIGDEAIREIVASFVAAWERGDVDALVTMLTEDADLTMPPLPTWYHGREAIAVFLSTQPLAQGTSWRLIPTSANGQLAFGKYHWVEASGTFVAHGIMVLTLRKKRIAEITAFLGPETLGRFGLPNEIRP